MQRQSVQPEGLATPALPYSPVCVSGDLAFISGQVPFDEQGQLVSEDFGEQVHQALRNLGLCLKAAGCGFEDVVKVNAYLSDLSLGPIYNEIYTEYFSPPYPARATVGAQLPTFKIEVEAVARTPT